MPFDQAAAICLISALSVLAFVGARHGARSAGSVALGLTLLLALVYAWSCSGKLAWAALFPAGWVLFWSNLMPVILSLAAGLATRAETLTGWHRPATTSALLVLAISFTVAPLVRPVLAPIPLATQSTWHGDICLQSHSSSCAPAAAATLLRLEGIDSDERSLASACLTSRQGTEPLGLYSGLGVATYGCGMRPRVASPDPENWIANKQLPCIALVRFANSPRNGSLRRLLGPNGDGHAVVVLRRGTEGAWVIADPAFGQTTWTDQAFRKRFTGDAIYLDRR